MQTVKCLRLRLADQACLAVLDLGDVVSSAMRPRTEAAVDLELLLARPALDADAGEQRTGDALQVTPHARQPRVGVAICARLAGAWPRACAGGEDVEDQLAAVEHLDALEARAVQLLVDQLLEVRRSARERSLSKMTTSAFCLPASCAISTALPLPM